MGYVSACRWQIVTAVVEKAAACMLKVQVVYFLLRNIKKTPVHLKYLSAFSDNIKKFNSRALIVCFVCCSPFDVNRANFLFLDFLHSEDRSDKLQRNVGNCLLIDMASYPRGLESLSRRL